MTLIAFTKNHQDLSTDRGYQFNFYCDKCGNGYMTSFQASVIGTAGSEIPGYSHVEVREASTQATPATTSG